MSNENKSNTLLIIDDDEINRGILKNIFEGVYKVAEAADGKTGLSMILANRNDLCAVFLDVVMPEMDGIEVLKKLEENDIVSKIPIFLITAHTDASIIRTAYEMGVMDVISKPVIPFVIQRRVQSVVELFQARKRLGNIVVAQQSELLEKAQTINILNQGMIEALSTAIEFRNGESGEHVRRIHDITKFLLSNTELGAGLTQEQIDNIAVASIMHDVGKIAIPDAILNKPARLTKEEYEVMKTHTIQGAYLLEKIPQLHNNGAYEYACDIARHHHERWDGHGYPDGLKGDEISIWAQVVSIADVYDALTSKRVYKDAFTAEEALRMIRDGECGTFNPKLLECFLSVEKQIRQLYEKTKEVK